MVLRGATKCYLASDEQERPVAQVAHHTSNIVPERLTKRVWSIKFQSSPLNIYFRLCGFRPRSCLFTSATGRISVHTAPKYATKPIRFVTLHFPDRHVAALLRHRNRSSCVWTEALSDTTVFVAAQKVSGMVRTKGHLLRTSVRGWRWGKKKIEFFSFRARFPCILAEFIEKTDHRTGRLANLENKNYLRVDVN